MTFEEPPPFTVEAQGQTLTFHPGGRERLEALLGLIESARQSIRMCFYIFAEDASGTAVRDALTAAARRGVAVDLLLDGFGADAREAFFAPMKEAGGSFSCFSAKWSQRYLIRNHQKIVVVDDRVAMIGGFNVEDSYFESPDEQGWMDLGVVIEGSIVGDLSRWYDQLDAWTHHPRPSWRAVRRMVREWDPGKGPAQVLIGGPTRGLSSWARCVRADLTGARRVDMIMAYFSPSWRSLRAIATVARRDGARLVMAGKSDNGATIGATRALYTYLLKRRTKIWEFMATKLHTKLIVIDDKCYIGSANFDMRSLYLNLEVMLRIEDAGLAERLREFIDRHIPASVHVTPSVHKKRANPLNWLRWKASWFLVAVVDYTVSRRLNLGL
ncbi:Major cardiolipin synthase ClsA [Tsuneonella dongtanensis]|uniref:Phospholipase D n=1 Tax=Tsuneonella dongtanensis TaxID=692370 RepID=A0A1B2A921_9SPHN|nr:phosphatidylserine/phosphatidylglycerophosphate/cardiolipin synthase family protein [Tsuneonella dongtanensis]ANY18574.1 Major cardiolipin synthase ClsA [Tsuneonella dongtanensis]